MCKICVRSIAQPPQHHEKKFFNQRNAMVVHRYFNEFNEFNTFYDFKLELLSLYFFFFSIFFKYIHIFLFRISKRSQIDFLMYFSVNTLTNRIGITKKR